MSYSRITWVPDALRAAGLKVVEHDGWRSRGLSTERRFEPRAVVWHHDASAPGDSPYVPASMIARFETAAAQLWVDRYGRWHIIASGRAPHAGVVLPGKPDNYTSIGIETDHTSGEDWPPALLESLRTGTAVILKHLGVSAEAGLHFHKEICSPPGRKIDPAGLDLAPERSRVAAKMKTPVPPKHRATAPVLSLREMIRCARRRWVPLTPVQVIQLRRLRAAMIAEGYKGLSDYRRWQLRLGYSGQDADGIPGKSSLSRLAARHGLRVVA